MADPRGDPTMFLTQVCTCWESATTPPDYFEALRRCHVQGTTPTQYNWRPSAQAELRVETLRIFRSIPTLRLFRVEWAFSWPRNQQLHEATSNRESVPFPSSPRQELREPALRAKPVPSVGAAPKPFLSSVSKRSALSFHGVVALQSFPRIPPSVPQTGRRLDYLAH